MGKLSAVSFFLLFTTTLLAEPTLRVKRGPKPKVADSETSTPHEARPNLSLSVATPLGRENTFDKRFTSYGLVVLGDFPVTALNESLQLSVEGGISLMLSRVTIPLLDATFSHIFLELPLRMKVSGQLSPTVRWEFFAGIQAKLLEYDSRAAPDGGIYGVSEFFKNLDPDFGAGLTVALAPSIGWRTTVGFLKLTTGVTFEL